MWSNQFPADLVTFFVQFIVVFKQLDLLDFWDNVGLSKYFSNETKQKFLAVDF